MLNRLAKFLLVATSLSPILGAVAVNQISAGKAWQCWLPWIAVALLLVLVCWWLLRYSARNIQRQKITIEQFESGDKEVLAFLLAYLLPFISADNMSFNGQWITGVYILVIIFLAVAHAGALHFNPVMGLLGYHFYSVKSSEGVSQLLISKIELRRPGKEIETVRLAHNIYLHIGGKDA
jgi:hypothetical protein